MSATVSGLGPWIAADLRATEGASLVLSTVAGVVFSMTMVARLWSALLHQA